MTKVIQFRNNELEYPHVICADCGGNLFHVATNITNNIEVFHSLVCLGCRNVIHLDMQPVFSSEE